MSKMIAMEPDDEFIISLPSCTKGDGKAEKVTKKGEETIKIRVKVGKRREN